MTAAEVNGKSAEREGTTPATTETGTTSDAEQTPEDSAFTLTRIRNSAHSGLPASSWRLPSKSFALFHTGSQNGNRYNSYPADSNDIANGGAGIPGSWTPDDKDPFEVAFDGGDTDPMSPRSMNTARKWLIVSVLSGAGLCLSVTSLPPGHDAPVRDVKLY